MKREQVTKRKALQATRDSADAIALTACVSFPQYAAENNLDLRTVQNRAARLRKLGLMDKRRCGRKGKVHT